MRELSKVMDGANKAHQKALFRAIKFVEQTKDRQLILKPYLTGKNWEFTLMTKTQKNGFFRVIH